MVYHIVQQLLLSNIGSNPTYGHFKKFVTDRQIDKKGSIEAMSTQLKI